MEKTLVLIEALSLSLMFFYVVRNTGMQVRMRSTCCCAHGDKAFPHDPFGNNCDAQRYAAAELTVQLFCSFEPSNLKFTSD